MMISSEKKIRELSEILNKDNPAAITGAVELLGQGKSFTGAIGLLTAYYDKTDDLLIRKTISCFMNDLKDQSACEEVMTEIKKRWKSDTIRMLVSSCWQSGLNYSEFTPDLAKVFLEGDYITAVECLTVIEESVHKLSRARKAEVIKLIEESPLPAVDEKSALALELISILEK